MADDPREEELEAGAGKLLPGREMMSLVSTDPVPVDPVYSTLVPPGGTVEGPVPGDPPLGTLPVEGADAEAGTDDPDRQETFQDTDSASAG